MHRGIHRGVVAATLIAFSGGAAYAQEYDSGFYAGAGLGRFDVEIDGIEDADVLLEDLDSDDTAWKVFGGWRFNPYISLEAAYVDFGTPGDNFEAGGTSGDYELDVSGFAPFVIGTLPVGPVELFAKLGYYFYDIDLSVDVDDLGEDVFTSDTSEEDLIYGVGAGMTFFERLNARLEYEEVDLDTLDNANAFWLSGSWRF